MSNKLFRRTDSAGNVISQNWYVHINGQKKSTGCSNKTEAKEVAELLAKKERAHKHAGLNVDETIEQVLDRYYERQTLLTESGEKQAGALRKRLCGQFPVDELYRVPNRIMPFSLNPNRLWSSMTNRDLDQIMMNRKKEGYAAASINKEIDQLQQIQKYCKKNWGIKINHEMDFDDLHQKVKKKTRAASVEEEQRLIDAMNPTTKTYLNNCSWERAPKNQRIWSVDSFHLLITYLDLGLRSAEGRKILWSEVDTVNWIAIRVWRSKTDRNDMLQMTDRLRAVLQSRWKHRGSRNSPFVFPHASDPKKYKTGCLGALRTGIDRAGLNDPEIVKRHGKFTVHRLRDSYATRLTEQGIIPSELMHLLGHANEEMSMKYIHMRPSDAMNKGHKLRNSATTLISTDLEGALGDAYDR